MGRIQQARYDHLLRRTTAQYGGGSKVGEALEDLFPVLEVESVPAELLRSVGWTLGAGQTVVGPAAGTRAVIQLFNPVGSGHLIVLTSYFFSITTAGEVAAGPSFDALTGSSLPGQQRDTRANILRNTVGLIQEEDDALVANLFNYRMEAQITVPISDQNDIAVLAPGTGWRLRTFAIDIPLRVSFLWRERVAEPEELNF